MKPGAILGLSAALIPMLTPIIFHPSTAAAVLLHGSTGAALGTTAFVTAIVVFIVKRRASDNGSGGTPKLPRRQVFALLSFVMLALFLAMTAGDFAEYRRLVAIQQHGGRAEADVVRIYTDGCGRSSCSIDVEYRYALPTPPLATPVQVTGYGYLTSDRHPDDARLVHARDSGHVPIAYDTRNPQVSAINFDDGVFKDDHLVKIMRLLKLFGALALMCLVPIAILFAAGSLTSRTSAVA